MASAMERDGEVGGPLRTFPVIQGLATLSRTEVRRPPRPQPEPADVVTEYGSAAEGLAAFPAPVR